jgi:hypothetical protein
MKHGALQLSMNFVITILIGIALLGFGILFLRQIVGGAEELKFDLDRQTERQLGLLLEQGQQIAIPFNTQYLRRGKSHLFGVGVMNIQDEGLFEVTIELGKAVGSDGAEMYPSGVDEWLRYDRNGFSLGHSARETISLLIMVADDATAGTYIFNVDVLRDGQQYDNTKKIYVVVE